MTIQMMHSDGDRCPRFGPDCCGRLSLEESENCSCHVRSPCSSCLGRRLVCDDCGWATGDDDE